MHPKVWEASGHVGGFNDPLIDDKKTGERFRADKLIEEKIQERRGFVPKWIEKLKNDLAANEDFESDI
ncbi:MAG: hypothetical protein H6765_03040 [Candidatus Peribacteria bacterium]|nr:MAG: hypothetical protein H6765_03040 [Candidatus Peribacteria bacterium]